MERLTIDEIIEHCKRKTTRYEKFDGIKMPEPANISDYFMREYWTYRLAAEYLDELKQYRAIGTINECQEAMERQTSKISSIHGDGNDDETSFKTQWCVWQKPSDSIQNLLNILIFKKSRDKI